MKTFTTPRITILFFLLLAGFAALEWRLIKLQVLRHEELEDKAEAFRRGIQIEQSWRGPIRDRNQVALAITVPVKDIYADLETWTNRVALLAPIVAPLLGLDSTQLARHVQQSFQGPEGRHAHGAVLIKKGVAPSDWTTVRESLAHETFGLQTNVLTSRQRTQLKGLRRWTLFARDDQRRYYPHGDSLAQVLGFVGAGTNGHLLQGKWGIESSMDSLLAGQNGVLASSHDAAGNELAFSRTSNLAVRDGAGVVLTIDLTLQKIVEEKLAKVMTRYGPSNASCVVVRPATGEILALVSLPAFSPQQPGASPPSTWRNRVISDRYEVGSVFKVVTLSAALELGAVNLNQQIFCENGHWVYRNSTLHDAGHHYGYLPVRDCLSKSSNIGFGKIGLLVEPYRLYDFMCRFGLDRATGVPLPYETPGYIRHPTNWSATSITHLAIGHELAISQLQLAMAYAAIANDGRLMRPMLVSGLNHADGTFWGRYEPKLVRIVAQPETARLVREAMQGVVEHGTGKAAALPDHTVAGKTGTAQKSDGHKYIPGRLYCSFIGMVPAGRPELVIAVAVDEPKDSAYGGVVAAPVFREIAELAVVLYNIAPDKEFAFPRRSTLSQNTVPGRGLIARDP